MPNHVTNILTFKTSSEGIEEILNTIKGEEETIDFNKIIPMPNSLQITSGSQVDNGIAVLKFLNNGDDSKLKPMLDYAWVKAENITTCKQLADYLVQENRVNLEEAAVAINNEAEHGFKDWYSWSIANWDTKWNAYSTSSNDNSVIFDTAWSTPMAVVVKLSSMFPDVEMTLEFADEDFGHNCGVVTLLAGQIIEEDIPDGGSAEAYALAAKVQDIGIDQLLYYIADTEDEEFATNLISTMFTIFSPKELVEEVEFDEDMHFSDTFLNTLKEMLIDNEEYELISKVDTKINSLKETEGEQ